MEGAEPFAMRLAAAVEERRAAIEANEIPKLKELCRVFHSSFQGLHQLLVRKGLVQQDPYKSDQKISGITPPEDDPYLESERELKIGIRLDAYDNVLEFLNNYFEFRTDTLGFKELRQLSDLIKFVSWDNMSPHSNRPTTRGLADLVGRARGGQDSFANSIIADALEQLSRNMKMILELIKSVATFKREEYKLMLREQLLPSFAPEKLAGNDDEALKLMRRQHKALSLPGPFVPELAAEVLAEEHAPDAEERRREALARLSVKQEESKKARPKESLRDVLVSAIRGLSAASRPLEAIGENLRTNAEIAQQQTGGFMDRFRRWIDKLTNRRPEKASYTVEFTEETTGVKQSETIVLEDFLEVIAKKSRLYSSFLTRAGGPWMKLQKASDEQLYQYINRELGECHLVHRRAGALDEHLKEHAPPSERKKMKGVKIELSSVRNAIVNANQLKHDYVAKKEEIEQLKKLGVDP